MFDWIDLMLFGTSVEDAIAVDGLLEAMWEELDMLEETGDLGAMDSVFAKYHHNLMAITDKAETHPAWAVT